MLLRHEHHFELFLVIETIKVWRSSLQDLFDLSIRPCVVGVLGAPCFMVMPLFWQNVSMI